MCRLPHSRRKRHSLTPKRCLDWWCCASFFLRLCQEVLLRGFRWFFFFRCSFCRKRKVNAECVSLPHEWNSRPHTAGQTGKNACCHPAEQVPSDWKQAYFLCRGGALFTLPVKFFFFQTVSSFYGFSPEVFSTQSASGFVYLHFAPFSKPHQSVIFVLGAKVIPGLDGKARSSLLFSVKISSPAGSILTEKPCIP